MIEGAIGPKSDDTEELSMKAPMSVSKPADVGGIVQASKPDLMARGAAFDLLQMAKGVGSQYEAAEYEDLSGEKSLTLDRIAVDDRRSHRA